MIKFTPEQRSWEESAAFSNAIHEKLADSVRERLRREIVGADDIFVPDPAEDPREPLEVFHDEAGIEITVEAPTQGMADAWGNQIKRVVREEAGSLPLEEAKKAVNRDDPVSMTPPPKDLHA